MSPAEILLFDLEIRDVRLSVFEGKLRYSAPKGVLTDDMKRQITTERPQIIKLIEERGALIADEVPIPLQSRDKGLPLSSAQERFWFLDQLDSGNSAAFVMRPIVLQMSGPLFVESLEYALQAFVARHEVLRSAFHIENNQPVQVPQKNLDVQIKVLDIMDLSADVREVTVQETIRKQALTPFNLQSGEALLRPVLLMLEPQEHVFILTLHHIVADGWSMGILVDELAMLYSSYIMGRPSELPSLPVQYADYAAWERSRLSGRRLSKLNKYWFSVLSDAPDFLELPTDHPRPRVRRNHGMAEHFMLDLEFTARFKKFCLSSAVTPFMGLLAAFGVLLSRYGDTEDLVIGTPISVRPHSQLEDLVGLFLNTVALRLDLTGKPNALELLSRVRERALGAFENAEMPFDQLLQSLSVERNLDRTPLFQVLFVLQNASMSEVTLEGLKIKPRPTESRHSPFDLVLDMEETSDGLKGFLRYNTDLFESKTIVRMLGHFKTILKGMVEIPERPVQMLPMLDLQEMRVLEEWRGEGKHFAVKGTLTERFEFRAKRLPDAIAVRLGRQSISYIELDRRANQLAQRLVRKGVKPADLIGLCIGRSLELIIGIIGILKVGAAYVPLDPTYPVERLSLMMEDSGLSTLIYLGSTPFNAALTKRCIDLSDPTLKEEPLASVKEGSADSIAYVIYTSGSTGRPKGVEVTHANVMRLFDSSQHLIGYGEGDVWSFFHSHSFDFSVWEIWGALLYGGTLVIIPYEVTRSPELFLKLLSSSGVTMLNQTPSAFRQLIEADCRTPAKLPLALKWVVFGGEVLDPRILEPWVKRRGADTPQLINMYGITETTVHVSFHHVTAENIKNSDNIIGRALPDVSIDIVDRHGQLVPVGVAGEMLIGGAGVARGYLNRPELTTQRFINKRRGRFYRSGDLARWCDDGSLEYLGRIDNQVKIRGFRIELGEIEAALASHPLVSAAVVNIHEDDGGVRLLAWVVSQEWANRELHGNIRAHLQGLLPDYMMPARIFPLMRLPLTGNGKLDHKSLLAHAAEQKIDEDPVGEPPRSPMEQWLATLWTEVLGRSVLNIDSNFFELGGDSIRAAILINKIQDKLCSVIYVVALFEAPTTRRLADYIRKHYPEAIHRIEGEGIGQPSVDVVPVTEEDVAQFSTLIPPMPRLNAGTHRKNPRAIFVLSPPRSGSTLLRVLLGGHKKLFSPPELELLCFATLGQRQQQYTGRDAFWLEGALRAVMEARSVDANKAREIMSAWEKQDMPVADFYGELQSWIAIQDQERLLVDKSPSYALDISVMQRAEDYFEDPLYLHLHRHPLGMISSFEEAKLDQIFFRYPHGYTTRRLAELIWLQSHRNIQAFLHMIPKERQLDVSFEQMTRAPKDTAQRLCDFIGISFNQEMLDIHAGGRMTDGLHAESRMLGDVKFHGHKSIDPVSAERWRQIYDYDFLGEPSWLMAEKLGYSWSESWPNVRRGTLIPATARGPEDGVPASFAQQRLWFLDQLEGAGKAYHMPIALHLTGELNIEALSGSFHDIVERHEVLRSRFKVVDGKPEVFADVCSSPLQLVDISILPARERKAEIQRLIRAHAEVPFDLANGPLIRASLLHVNIDQWLLLLNMHHIISDGWSMGVLASDWTAQYKCRRDGHLTGLAPLAIQYADYAAWQRSTITSELLSQQIAYWSEQLNGAPPLLQLPTDRPRPAVQQFSGGSLLANYPTSLGKELRRFADRSGVSLYMLLLAAFGVLLIRYSGQRDVVIGSPIANRARSELEPLIGFFVNTLVLRLEAQSDLSFGTFLADVRNRALEAYAHPDVPFEQLVEELRPLRNLSYSPLFQVMFSLQNLPPASPEFEGVSVKEVSVDQSVSKFDLTLSITERSGALEAVFEYNSDLFDLSSIDRLSQSYLTLLESILEAPDMSIDQLPIIPFHERQQLVDEWNRTEVLFEPPFNIVGLFEAQALKTPDAVALVCGERRLTYVDLNQLAEQFASQMCDVGLEPGNLVGVCVRRSPEMLAALLAVQKCDCAYVPIDPDYPAQRIRQMLDDSSVVLLFTEEGLLTSFSDFQRCILCSNGCHKNGLVDIVEHSAVPEDLAYIIYTSGSTGRPKGVMVGQKAAVNFLRSMARIPGISASDRMLAVTTVSFDIAVLELYLPLIVGARIVLAGEAMVRDGDALIALMERESVTMAQATPATWHMLIDSGWQGNKNLTVLCGGEAMPSSLAGELLSRCTALWNMYGPTETTVWSTVKRIDDDCLENAVMPVGKPIANTTVSILDKCGQPQPIGVTGELLIGGLGLSAGYLGSPELTSERFIVDPHNSGNILYRTGDLARYLSDGTINILGRVDQQIKLNGYRIELGEIEHILLQEQDITACAVTVDKTGTTSRLVAYYSALGSLPDNADMRRRLGKALPVYMIPNQFVRLDALPLTPNGKVDRKALKPVDDGLQMDDSVGFRDPIEHKLTRIWEDVIGVNRIGLRHNFFELGGNSIIAVQLIARVANAFGRKLQLAMLFQGATVETMAMLLREGAEPSKWSSLVSIRSEGIRPTFFCCAGAGGNVIYFHDLARNLPENMPFCGLQPPGLDGVSSPLMTVEALATHYLDNILCETGAYPKVISGHSFGGLVAFEMARQLECQGLTVTLVLIDTAAPHFFKPTGTEWGEAEWLMQISQIVEHLYSVKLGVSSEEVNESSESSIALLTQRMILSGVLPPGTDTDYLKGFTAVYKANLQVEYAPQPLAESVRVLILRACDAQPDELVTEQFSTVRNTPELGWRAYIKGDLHVEEVPGDHLSMMRPPNVEVVADAISRFLDKHTI